MEATGSTGTQSEPVEKPLRSQKALGLDMMLEAPAGVGDVPA